MGKKKKDSRGKNTGSEAFDYTYGYGQAGDLMKRYDVKGAKSVKPSAQTHVSKTRTHDEVKEDIAAAMMNDYDTRRSMEAAAMAGDKDARKFAEGGFESGNIGDAWGKMKDLKKEYVGGGGMDGAKNRASLTQALVDNDRQSFIADNDAKYAPKGIEDQFKQEESSPYEGDDKDVSDELKAAKERAAAWTESGGQGNPTPYGGESSSSGVYGGADDQQAEATIVADSLDRDHVAQGYLAEQKAKLKQERNFKATF